MLNIIMTPDAFLRMHETSINFNNPDATAEALSCFMIRNPDRYAEYKEFYYDHHPIIHTRELFERAERFTELLKNYYINKCGGNIIIPKSNNHIKHLI